MPIRVLERGLTEARTISAREIFKFSFKCYANKILQFLWSGYCFLLHQHICLFKVHLSPNSKTLNLCKFSDCLTNCGNVPTVRLLDFR